MRKGRFITIEGQDGAGKSTNIDAIVDALDAREISYLQTREPGGTPLGEIVREILLGKDSPPIADLSELLLVFAARAQHLEQVIKPALEKGTWVVCDRFTDATFAYQGGGRNMDNSAINALQELVQQGLSPDLTVLLDVAVDVGESRAGERSEPDRFERENVEFKKRVRATYLELAHKMPQRIKVVDASLSIDAVKTNVTQIVDEFLDKHLK